MNQPFLQSLVCLLQAPVQWWCKADGNLTGEGVEGVFCGDDRVVAGLELEVTSHEVEPLGHAVEGAEGKFVTILRTPAEGADPVVTLTRRRRVSGDGVRESLVLESAAEMPQGVTCTIRFVPDATLIPVVKAGGGPVPPADPARLEAGSSSWRWRNENTVARLEADGEMSLEGHGVNVSWTVEVGPNESAEFGWSLRFSDSEAKFVPADVAFDVPTVALPALQRLLDVSVADLKGLTMAEKGDPTRYFAAAGAPWYFTLFGRDSLMTATMAAKASPELALATLRTLAARQGSQVNVSTAEQPGKILHEVRRIHVDMHDERSVLPPEYYGTIDATLLWLMLAGRLVDLGHGAEVAELLDHVVAALGWIRDHADPDGDGFLEYFDESGHGLANQGWKDSGDSIRFADGTIADGSIVLIEVQGYAAAAAQAGARILAEYGRTDEERASAEEWVAYAEAMATRIREHFWLEDDEGPYLAIALDGAKRPVTGVSSNMGHLLGLGVLSEAEERQVVARLTAPPMASGYGIRTMSTTNGAYWPMRYHVGSVWTHDTAWIIDGMARAGFHAEAQTIARQLHRAAEGFEFRLPELFGGWGIDEVAHPMPYPASCRPQAWAAASAFVLADVLADAAGA